MTPTTTVGEALNLMPKRAHGAVVVLDENRVPVGLTNKSDTVGVDRYAQVHEVMTTGFALVSPESTPQEVFDTLTASRQQLAVAVAEDGSLVGVMSAKEAHCARRSTILRWMPRAVCGPRWRSASAAIRPGAPMPC